MRCCCHAAEVRSISLANSDEARTGLAEAARAMPLMFRLRRNWWRTCMSQLELFLHEERPDLPVLVQAALIHAQFESIHPFLDGNGRIGRLLITLLLLRTRRDDRSQIALS